MDNTTINQYRRALSVGLALSLIGELIYWVIWGLILFPGHPWTTFRWALTCGVGMGAVVGTLSCLLIVDRLRDWLAVVAGFAVAFSVFSLCAINCWLMDQPWNYWGAVTQPQLFLIGGFVGASLGGLLYAWLVFTQSGSRLLDQGFRGVLSKQV